jgi:hypothetical protein
MESAWLIRFKNGNKVILSEKVYKQKYLKETPKDAVKIEEHWFSVKDCIRENPDTDILD